MRIIEFDTIDSTQSYLKSLDVEKNTDLVVWAHTQKEGRGRTGKEWLSPRGGLWFSFIYDAKKFDIEEVPFLTIETGKAVKTICEKYYGKNIGLEIKYPNDLLLNGKKVAGIICELLPNNKVIVGIGVNTNFESNQLKDLDKITTTFREEFNTDVNNEEFMKDVIKKSKERYRNLKRERAPGDRRSPQ